MGGLVEPPRAPPLHEMGRECAPAENILGESKTTGCKHVYKTQEEIRTRF
jgi:hypothetical protein